MHNKYFLLRHGETIYQTKKKGRIYPWPERSPVRLTKKGEKQIKIATKQLKNKKIDLIFASDFFRTRQTAKIVAKELGLKIKFDKRLWDINSGVYQGGFIKDYRQFFSVPEQRFSKRPPKGENWRDVIKRTSDFLKEVERKYKNKRILIVSHGDPILFLAGAIKGISEDEFLKTKSKRFYLDVGQFLEP